MSTYASSKPLRCAPNRLANAIFSATVSHGISRASWKTTPVRGRPSSDAQTTAPALSSSNPASTRNKVDFPLPLGPKMARNSPVATRTSTSRNAVADPKCLVPFSIRTASVPTATVLPKVIGWGERRPPGTADWPGYPMRSRRRRTG
ncbi:Uncharacterised protein [Mycobacteroides abscessus subsp. abscessus]|nr:Uncharacterised protein [Mycobacteroides abscessus subsp. abscessus]